MHIRLKRVGKLFFFVSCVPTNSPYEAVLISCLDEDFIASNTKHHTNNEHIPQAHSIATTLLYIQSRACSVVRTNPTTKPQYKPLLLATQQLKKLVPLSRSPPATGWNAYQLDLCVPSTRIVLRLLRLTKKPLTPIYLSASAGISSHVPTQS